MPDQTTHDNKPTIMTAEQFMQLSDILSDRHTPVKDYIWKIIITIVVFLVEIVLWYHWAGRVTAAMAVVNAFLLLAIVIPYCRFAVWDAKLWASGPRVLAWRQLWEVDTVTVNNWPITFEAFRSARLYKPKEVNGVLVLTFNKNCTEGQLEHQIDALRYLLRRAAAIEKLDAWPSKKRLRWIEDLLDSYNADRGMIWSGK